MQTVPSLDDIELERWCDHKIRTSRSEYYRKNECQHCFGTGYAPTEFGLSVIAFLTHEKERQRIQETFNKN